MNRKVIFDTPEAADFLGMAEATLSQWRYKRKGPAYIKYSGRKSIRYKREDLEEFMNQARVVPGYDSVD